MGDVLAILEWLHSLPNSPKYALLVIEGLTCAINNVLRLLSAVHAAHFHDTLTRGLIQASQVMRTRVSSGLLV
eukprot:4133514-Amphidinium_carterae.1